MSWRPGAIRNRETKEWQAGMCETHIPTLPNGRSARTPGFRPLAELAAGEERDAVIAWARESRPDLTPTA